MPTSFKLVGFGIVVMLLGIATAQKDFRLSMWGKKVKGQIIDGGAWVDKSTGKIQSLEMQYRFTDDKGKEVRGASKMSASYRVPEDLGVEIIYLSGNSEINQLSGRSSSSGYWMFFAGIGLIAGGVWYFNRESVAEAHAETARTLERAQKRTLPGRLGLHD